MAELHRLAGLQTMAGQVNLRVSIWKVQAVGWASLIFFSFCAVMAWVYGQRDVSPWFIPFILLALHLLLFAGPITASPEGLWLTTPLGRFQMAWREIERIEYGGSSIVFFAGGKRLSIPAANWWAGSDKQSLLAVINDVIRERQIEVKWTIRADYLFTKNVRAPQP